MLTITAKINPLRSQSLYLQREPAQDTSERAMLLPMRRNEELSQQRRLLNVVAELR
jgi:hypothetical protein